MKQLAKITLIFAASAMFCQAADFRTWTSRRGSSIEAQMIKYKDGSVKLVTKEPKEIVLKVTDLCLADRQYLIEYAEANPDVILKGAASVPEHAFKKPKPFLVKLDKKFSFGEGSSSSAQNFELYETEHFLYAVGKGVRATGIAETAEACWHGMAFQHFEFRENWGETKQLIVLPSDTEGYSALGRFEVARLKREGQTQQAAQIEPSWDKVGANSMGVPSALMEEHKLKERASIYNVKEAKRFRRKFDSFQTHVISRHMFAIQVGGVSSISKPGHYALSTGHAYYKEIQLSKKTETNLLSEESGGLATKSGFDDGSGWAKILKKMVKKGDITLTLDDVLGVKNASNLTPESLVSMYSLSCYMQSTQQRIASYAKLARLINTSDQIPETTELVKIFGFESIEEFEKDWTAFVTSRDFK